MNYLKKFKKPIVDLVYSLFAYALPTLVLQFAIYPFLDARLPSEQNGLFLTLFNVVRLCVSLFITPLANMRLLKKSECAENASGDKGFNFVFVAVLLISSAIVAGLGVYYYGASWGIFEILRLLVVLALISAHDYYSIAFRVNITYKSILVDNLMIIVGYGIGIVLMIFFGYWELIFISGYSLGLLFTLIKTKLWRRGIRPTMGKKTVSEYAQLTASSGLNNATTYCDKMLIYPMIGGYSVSVYNAASVVSKMMSIVSVPIRNVFLSYIVDVDRVRVGKKGVGKLLALLGIGTVGLYGAFYLAGVLFCRILYSKRFEEALGFIPIILLAILFETYSGFMKVYLLRFEKTILQVVTSVVKIVAYLLCIVILVAVLKMGLLGFCLAILIADGLQLAISTVYFIKNLKKQLKQDNAQSNAQ